MPSVFTFLLSRLFWLLNLNLWCFNLSILPTDASVDGNYIDLRTAQYNLRCIVQNNNTTAFGKSSLNLNMVNTLHDLKNTSNAFMHVNAGDLNISNIKKAGQTIQFLYPEKFKECSPCIKLGKSSQDSTPVVATILCGLLGWFGAHHFYAGNIFKGILYLLTCGCFLFGPLYNLNQLRRGTFVSKKRGALVKTRWSTILACIFMALHIYLLYRMLF
jgi:TM2 domain-containing membrane protein YozV